MYVLQKEREGGYTFVTLSSAQGRYLHANAFELVKGKK